MFQPDLLKGKRILVTGGGTGLGRSMAQRYLELGANVIICGRRPPESVPTIGGRGADFIVADVREIDQIDSVLSHTKARYGRLER